MPQPPTARLVVLVAGVLSGCATLGPTPATTGISPVEARRTSVEVQGGFVPGYFLSSATVEEPKGSPIGQLSGVFEPGPALGIPGLIIGVRSVGPAHDNQAEPMLGYRHSSGTLSGLAVASVARGNATDRGAYYHATRAGGEVAIDLRVFDESAWLEPHLVASVSVTGLTADGDYCVDETGRYGRDCPMPSGAPPPARVSAAEVFGVYPAATVGIAVHGFSHRDSWFHGARAVVLLSGGAMPRVVAGEQERARGFLAIGAALSLAVGSNH